MRTAKIVVLAALFWPILRAQTIDLPAALARAREYSSEFQAAELAISLAKEDRIQARAARLPTVSALSQYSHTQANGTDTGVFVGADGVHVYSEQAVVHAEVFSFTKNAEYRGAIAAEATANARRDVAIRGLTVTVIQNYYSLVAAQRRLVNATRNLEEARRFLDISEKQERGGEVAHADVIKAQLQVRQREREMQEASAGAEKAKLGLGVLLFSDLKQAYSVADDLQAVAALPANEDARLKALSDHPALRVAQSSLTEAGYGVRAAKGERYPTFTADYLYGISANNFGVNNHLGQRNLGSAVQATVTIPIWNWGSAQSKVRLAELRRKQAEMDLSFTKRQVEATMAGLYLEARAAQSQLESLRLSQGLAEEGLRLMLLRYQSGEASALEVVDAQSTAAEARNAYDDGLIRNRLVIAELQVVTGGL